MIHNTLSFFPSMRDRILAYLEKDGSDIPYCLPTTDWLSPAYTVTP